MAGLGRPVGRHAGRCTMAHVDGHAQSMSVSEMGLQYWPGKTADGRTAYVFVVNTPDQPTFTLLTTAGEDYLQIAGDGDIVDDATEHWPTDRLQVLLGVISLTALVPNDDPEGKRIIFDPVPRIDGIEASADPLLESRADVYLMSGRRRRAAALK